MAWHGHDCAYDGRAFAQHGTIGDGTDVSLDLFSQPLDIRATTAGPSRDADRWGSGRQNNEIRQVEPRIRA